MPGMTNTQASRLERRNLIDPRDVPNRSLRLGEVYSKVKLFELEELALKSQSAQFREASQSYGDQARRIGDQYQITKLDKGKHSAVWRDQVLQEIRGINDRLLSQSILLSYEGAVRGHVAGYYLRSWVMDVATKPEVKVNSPILGFSTASRTVVSEALADPEILRLLGSEWARPMTLEFEELFIKIKKSLNLSMTKGLGIDEAVRDLRKLLGTSSSPGSLSGTFGKLNTLTRTYILDASNQGAARAYQQNQDILLEMQHLTARDERVCPQCRPMNGTKYPIGEFFIPPRNTHPNCRCTVIPVLKEALLVDSQMIPSSTFGDFLLGLGVFYLLNSIWGAF